MQKQRIKLVGQLITDEKPVILAIEDTIEKIEKVVHEYSSVFPEIFLNCEWGYFKKPISQEKAKAFANLFGALNAPLQNVIASL